ncbi:hypothetical protein OKW36_001635 [Paraburkholderia sp. MM5482-R1]
MCGGDQKTLSRRPGSSPSGNSAGAQCGALLVGARERQRALFGTVRKDARAFEAHVAGRAVELLRENARELFAHAGRGQMHRAGHRARESARIIARRDGPRVLVRIEFDVHDDVLRVEPEHIRDDLRAHRHVALARWRRRDGDDHAAEQIDAHRRAGDRAVLRPGFLAGVGRHHSRDVSHVRYRRLHDRREADAI